MRRLRPHCTNSSSGLSISRVIYFYLYIELSVSSLISLCIDRSNWGKTAAVVEGGGRAINRGLVASASFLGKGLQLYDTRHEYLAEC